MAYHWYSTYLGNTGRYDEAIEQIRMAAELDPLSRIINAYYGMVLGYAGRHEEGAEQFRKTLELDPSWAVGTAGTRDVYRWVRRAARVLAGWPPSRLDERSRIG